MTPQQQQLTNSAMYNAQMNSAIAPQTSSTAVAIAAMPDNNNNNNNNNQTSSLIPFYQSINACDQTFKAERKRSREEDQFTSLPAQRQNKLQQRPPFNNNQGAPLQFQNRVLAPPPPPHHHTRQSRVLVLKEKEDEIQMMEKLNMALEQKISHLCLENQIWKEIAHTKEATTNYLRGIIALVGEQGGGDHGESICESNGAAAAAATAVGGGMMTRCRRCRVRESAVLLLPCRHLCLCTFCGSTVGNCPVCDSAMDATVHVNLS